MLTHEELAQHHYPKIKRRLVSIVLPVKSEGEHIAVLYSLISYLEVPQLVVWREIPHYHHRKKAQGDENEGDNQWIPGQYVVKQRLAHIHPSF